MIPSIVEAARDFRAGRLAPTELLDTLLKHIASENPRIGAFTEVFRDTARNEARAADRELREGTDRGPLHGIPVAVKDLFDVSGSVTTCGAHPYFHPSPAREDSEVVARLRRAGAVILGKTALHEWALGVTTLNPHHGFCRNPRDPDRIAGGSSGGSAAALASEMCLGALGTDTGGSIRIPASLCGVVGLKPSYNLVPTRGLFPLAPSLDHAGPMARTVADAFLLLQAISDWNPEPVPSPKFLVPERGITEDLDCDIGRAFEATLKNLPALRSVDLGEVREIRTAAGILLLSEAAGVHRTRLRDHPEKFGSDVRERMENGLRFTAAEVENGLKAQGKWRARLTGLLGADGILVTPTTPVTASRIDETGGVDPPRLLTRFTSPFNFAGAPALSLPARSPGPLPVGIQLVAAPGRESLLREAALIVEGSQG